MAFTRDWGETAPIDHTLNRLWPTNDRNLKVDISDRLKNILYGFTAGETDEAFKKVPLKTGSAPAHVADYFHLYGKDVSSKVELHGKDEDGNEIQLTSGGKINTAALKSAAVADIANLLSLIYPVGIVITLGVSTNPATLLGIGTWTAIEGRVIVGISNEAGDEAFDTLDKTGGAQTVSHTHSIPRDGWGDGAYAYGRLVSNAFNTSDDCATADGVSGDASDEENLQPYIVKYVWQRTA